MERPTAGSLGVRSASTPNGRQYSLRLTGHLAVVSMGDVSTRQQMQNAGATWLNMDRLTKLMFDPLPGGRAGLGPFRMSLRNVLPLVPGIGASLTKPRALARGEGARV